jgi:predicted transcriptional regulator of viral defense system
MALLHEYAVPRAKISDLLRKGALIRVKKGLYIFGDNFRQGPYCKEHLANLIYGPSAISLEYALSFYGMIPERVEEITSITLRRNKQFSTPVGSFSYRYIAPSKYSVGITQAIVGGRTILIAIPEKALCDMLYLNGLHIHSIQQIENYLFEDLRIERNSIEKLKLPILEKFAQVYKNPSIDLFVLFMNNLLA